MKILIVEDSIALAKIIAIKISKALELEIDIAKTLQEAKEYIKTDNYELALLDLFLPDANEGEAVDYFLEHNIPTIVMTASLDKNLQKEISKKDIVDYVLKDRVESIDYMIATINRVLKNKNHTALIVDDSEVYRSRVSKVLRTQLINTVVAKDGMEALEITRKNNDITFVVTDFHMPNLNGLELTLALRKSHKKDRFPIIGTSTDEESSIMFLKHGVNDFVKKPFFKEELSTRVNNTLDALENVQKLHTFANTDFLTGVSNRKHFYHEVGMYYHKTKKENSTFALAMIDIDYFKKVNDTYGHDVGDDVIRVLAKTIKDNIKGQDIVARFGGEEFCVVLKDIGIDSALKFFDALREKVAAIRITADEENQISFTISAGVATNRYGNLEEMVIQSDKHLYRAKNTGRNKVCSDKEIVLV
jgi:diguanylate cyclase (GGDEF)-like protein